MNPFTMGTHKSKRMSATEVSLGNKLSVDQLKEVKRCLGWAYLHAKDWRGSLTGNPNPQPLESFDYGLYRCRKALRILSNEIGGKHTVKSKKK